MSKLLLTALLTVSFFLNSSDRDGAVSPGSPVWSELPPLDLSGSTAGMGSELRYVCEESLFHKDPKFASDGLKILNVDDVRLSPLAKPSQGTKKPVVKRSVRVVRSPLGMLLSDSARVLAGFDDSKRRCTTKKIRS